MSILLINPATEQFGGILSRYIPVTMPIAIGTLAGYLRARDIQVRITDDEVGKLNESNIERLVVGMEKPYIFGLGLLTAQAHRGYNILRMLKKKYPDCYIILGGIHATAMPEEGIAKGADVIVRGEGETILHELILRIRSGQDYRDVAGITYRDSEGNVKSNPDALLMPNLDEIPIFPYDLFEYHNYDMGFIMSSRGCPYKCNYCSQRLMTGLTYRTRSPKNIVQELDVLINKYNQDYIFFYDDNFSFKLKRVKEVCDAVEASGLHKKASFSIQTRADNFYPAVMPHLKAANFTGVGFGMETAVQRLANEIQKDETIEKHIEAIKLAKEWGMGVTVFMIFGLPTETHEDRMESYRFIKKMGLSYTKFNNLIPYPGTSLYTKYKSTPQVTLMDEWSNFNSTLTATRSIFDPTPLPFVPENTTPWELKRDIMRANWGFYFSPRSIWNLITRNGGNGLVRLPAWWFLKPREVAEVGKLFFVLLFNYFIALLPNKFGSLLFKLVNFRKIKTIREKGIRQDGVYFKHVESHPFAIDGTMRDLQVMRKDRVQAATP